MAGALEEVAREVVRTPCDDTGWVYLFVFSHGTALDLLKQIFSENMIGKRL